jgi:hypothetical protein
MPEIPEVLKLGGLEIEVPDAAQKLGNLAQGQTFAQAGDDVRIPPLALNGETDVPLDETLFTLGGDARLEIAILNGPEQDPDQILEPVAGGAWLKHTLAAGIQGSTGGQVGGVEFGLQGGLGASLLQYRSHRPDEPLVQALVADLRSYLLPFRLQDVRNLKDGEVLAFTVRGKLALHAKLTWADALSAALSSLDERLGVAGVAAIQVDLGASLGVNLALEDDYRLVFRRGTNGTTRVELRKTRGRSAAGALDLGITARVADPAALQGALAAYATGRLGLPWPRVEELMARIDSALRLEDLPAGDRELAEKIGTRLGLSDLREEWQQLKERLDGLPDDLAQRLEQALMIRITAELALEYGRVSTEQAVLACELAADPLARHHHDLLRGNLAGLLDRLAARESGYRLIEYLKTTTITKRFSFGISIGIGRWAASGQDEVVRRWERQAVLRDDHERRSFTGRRTYKAVWGGRTYQYAFGLAGAMERFSAGRTATAGELAYSLSFGWSWQEPLTPRVLDDAFDLANVWKVLAQRENEANRNEVLTRMHGPVLIEVEIKISDAGVRSLLAVPDRDFEEAWIEAMAAALPRVHLPPRTFRTRVGDRVKAYGRAARFAFRGESEIAAIAGRVDYNPDEDRASLDQLQKIDRGASASGGLPDLSLKVLWTSSTSSTRPAGRCRRAKDALDRLAEAIRRKQEPDQAERTFDAIEDLITRPYEHRLLGRVVASLVAARAPGEIMKTLRVTPEDTPEDGTAILI